MTFLVAVLALFVVWASGDDDGAVAIGGAAPRTSRKQQPTARPAGGGFRCQVEALLGDLGVVLGLKTDAICGHDGPDAGESAEGAKGAGAREHDGRLGVERRPPDEQMPRRIDFQPDSIDPRWPSAA